MIGYDDIELVTEICSRRPASVRELENHLRQQNMLNSSEHCIKSDTYCLSPEAAQRRLAKQLQDNASRPLFTGIAEATPEILPNVFSSVSAAHGGGLSQFGSRYLLPLGTTRVSHDVRTALRTSFHPSIFILQTYEEVTVPPAKTVPPRATEHPIRIQDLDPLAKGCFPGYATLNRIQSIIYPTAYGTNENMLVCAPTGAGKTDVAMLTILRVLKQHSTQSNLSADLKSSIKRDDFKIIYVCVYVYLSASL
jgi:antiviral helicase SLH1